MIIEKYETYLRKANVEIIDLSDNLCWNDRCEVISPAGYGIFTDPGHQGKFLSRHWLSVVDHLA
jgi:hypothetical protein